MVEHSTWVAMIVGCDFSVMQTVGQFQVFHGVVTDVVDRILNTGIFWVEEVDGSLGIDSEVAIVVVLVGQSSSFDGGFHSISDIAAWFLMSIFSHTLEHIGWWIGAHQQVHGSTTDFMDIGSVLVGTVQHRTGQAWIVDNQVVQGDHNGEALEVSDLDSTLQVWLKDRQDLRVAKVSEGTNVNLSLYTISLVDGFTELMSKEWDDLVFDDLIVGISQTTEAEYWIVVVSRAVANMSLVYEIAVGKQSGSIQVFLVLNGIAGNQQEKLVQKLLGWVTDGLSQ